MDPQELLNQMRQNIKLAREARTEGEKVVYMTYAIHKMEELDKWLSNGGFLPKPWQWTTDDRKMV